MTPSARETPHQLEIWPEHLRGSTNAFARSGTFGVGNHRDPRAMLKRAEIPCLSGYRITYTGEELRQDDHDVFMQIVHLNRTGALGAPVYFTAHGMLVELGWTRNSESYERLRKCLERMKATAVTVALPDNSAGYSGSLIRSFRWAGTDGSPLQRWEVTLEPEIVNLYGSTGYTRLEWKICLSLPPLAKFLYKFYASHEVPYPYSVGKIHYLCGSKQRELRQFRYKLRQALEKLIEVGFLADARIDARSDLVHVERARRLAA